MSEGCTFSPAGLDTVVELLAKTQGWRWWRGFQAVGWGGGGDSRAGVFGSDSVSWAVTVCDQRCPGSCAKHASLKFQPEQ